MALRSSLVHSILLLALVACNCPKDSDSSSIESYHPSGWSVPDQHGMSAKIQDQVCVACHGEDLLGGSAGQSCDTCHPTGWRSQCIFCHGGTETAGGAPPVDIDNSASSLSFAEHTAHLEGPLHAAWDCGQCHVKPADALSSGHLFLGDSTPGLSELSFSGGLSPAGAYSAKGSCSNLYCHGNGRSAGSATSGATLDCGSCHGSASSTSGMSGMHSKHLREDGVSCSDCHSSTASGNSSISGPVEHVDGEIDVVLVAGISWSGSTCSGTCHGENHSSRSWLDDD